MERAIALGYVDDLRAARAKATKILAKGVSRALIEQKLRQAGVPSRVVAEVMAEAPEDQALAQTALARRFRSRLPSSERVARFLAGRGFDLELIEDVVRKLAG